MIRRLCPYTLCVFVGQLVGRGSPWRQSCDTDLRHTACLPKRFVHWTFMVQGRELCMQPLVSLFLHCLLINKANIDHVQTWVDYTTLLVCQPNSPSIVLKGGSKCSDTPHATSKAARGWLWKDLGQQWLSSLLAQMGIETAFLPL